MSTALLINPADGNLWAARDAALGRRPTITLPSQPDVEQRFASYRDLVERTLASMDTVRRIQKFAANHFKGDVRRTTHFLKEVLSFKLCEDLTRTYRSVDYAFLSEDADDTRITETIACAGGKCEIA